ncbi:hypothetical protein F511_03980 [Dorcoceras hygrometricum]|uniref:Uncharacterized protein n=1 Tax=Dorcoceras hygrometricum TaxID=472368 RepID=A0A2Z7D2Y6_9LAMI|nr:hypothetical protein F511_03980 [Dorcoceras hygrometricum]
MHPRLVDYNAVALVWMYCIFLLVILSQRAYADLAFLLVLCKSKTPSFLLNQALSFCNPNLAKHAIHQVLAPAGHCHRKILLLILIANAKRCRSNLFKRHRFAIANFTYHLLNLCLCASAESIPL